MTIRTGNIRPNETLKDNQWVSAMFAVLRSFKWNSFLHRFALLAALKISGRTTPFKTLELKVLLGFLGALVLIFFSGVLTYRSIAGGEESSKRVAHTLEVRALLSDLYSSILDAESAQRAYLLTGDASQRVHYFQMIEHVPAQQEVFARLISDNPVQVRNMIALHSLIAQRFEFMALVTAKFELQGLNEAQKLLGNSQGMETMNSIRALADTMDSVEMQLLKEREEQNRQTRNSTQAFMLLTVLLSVALLSTLFAAIRREMQIRDKIETYDGTHRQALLLYSSTYDRDNILRGLLDLLAERHTYPVSAFYSYEEWRGELVREAGHGLPQETPVSYCLGEGLVGEALQSNRAVHIADPGNGLLTIATGIGIINPAALLAVPVTFREQRKGVLVLASIIPFSEQELTFVEHVASRLGVALNNLKQFSDLKFMSDQLRARSEEISQKNIQLEAASRTKSEFLANMSHELRTPLNAIIGFSEALKDGLMGKMEESQLEYIDDIYSSGEHLLSLINDILDLAKVESGKMTLELEPVSLSAVLQNSMSMVKEKALVHHLKVKLNADPGMPEIVADMRKLKQIVYNLLSNAVKFTPDQGVITLDAHRIDGMLEIAVSDTGIGISPQDQGKLFQPFSQIDSTLSRQHQGTGLGLVMVKRLTELHGGSVGLESEAGKGSRFWVRIPWREESTSLRNAANVVEASAPYDSGALLAGAADVNQYKNMISAETTSLQIGPNTWAPRDTPNTPSVLVIEDDPSSAKLLTQQLEMEGLRVTRMASGELALEWLARNRPDLITLDLMLPGMDGWEVLSRIKLMPQIATVPVVIVSIVAEGKRGFAFGASQVLQKPVSHAELHSALTALSIFPSSGPQSFDVPHLVLVVDDDPSTVELMSRYLKHSGFKVSAAYSGADGISLARTEQPDAILLDLLMPVVSGFEVLEALKDNPATARIPVLIVTSKLLTAEDRQRLNGHVETILEKAGFRHETLIAEVRRALQKMR